MAGLALCMMCAYAKAEMKTPLWMQGEAQWEQPTVVNQWKGKKVAFLGDSITDKKRIGTQKCYHEFLAEWLGIEPVVLGINGNRMDGVLRQAERLKELVGDDVDAIFIFAGTNDYNGSVPLGEWYTLDVKETTVGGPVQEVRRHRTFCMTSETFRGRINKVMDYLKTNFPTKQVIMLTPLHRGFARFSDKNIQPPEEYANRNGNFVDEYVQAVKEAANVWAVPVIDLNALSGLYPTNPAHRQYFAESTDPRRPDLLHPNAEGHRRMALTLMYQLLALPAGF